ncbi:MAG: ATP-binding protein, partial [Terracidiphilus sp.]
QAGRIAGSGIGLAVVRALVDAHGGDIGVTSEPSRGSRFTVTLPGPRSAGLFTGPRGQMSSSSP